MGYRRFVTPKQGSQYSSEYDFGSDLIDDLQKRDVSPLFVVTLDLSTAGSQFFRVPSRAIVPYFWATGTTNKVRKPAGLVTIYPNQQDNSNSFFAFPAKHNRGFRGSFSQVFISWAAQASTSVDLVFLKSGYTPWMTDDIDPGTSSSGTGNWNVVDVVGSYAFSSTDTVVNVDASGGNATVTLPTNTSGRIAVVKKVDSSANTVTISGGTIDGAASQILNLQYDSFMMIADGTSWSIIG